MLIKFTISFKNILSVRKIFQFKDFVISITKVKEIRPIGRLRFFNVVTYFVFRILSADVGNGDVEHYRVPFMPYVSLSN